MINEVKIMSEDKVHELHEKLSTKLIEEAHAVKNKAGSDKLVSLEQEIVSLRREINNELKKLKGTREKKIVASEG
jgi:hypothetical protein